MENTKIQYKSDDFGNPLTARVCWDNTTSSSPKPIVLILHAGGYLVGSDAIVNPSQINYLTSRNCIVVIPNYRLCPQVSALNGAFADTSSAYTWSINTLPLIMIDSHKLTVDTSRTAVLGHSSGGTIALHLAAQHPDILTCATFYPSLYLSEPTSSASKPYDKPPFNLFPDYEPSDDEKTAISPPEMQVSEAGLATPGTPPAPRNRYQLDVLKRGKWIEAICPDGDLTAIDPCTQFESKGRQWPPTVFVSPGNDDVPGCGPHLVRRAIGELKEAGAREVREVDVPGEAHMFDLLPSVGTSDLGHKWEAVKEALDFVVERLQ